MESTPQNPEFTARSKAHVWSPLLTQIFDREDGSHKIVIVTHPRISDLREALKYIYNLYVEYVVKNPLYSPGNPIRCEIFNTNVDQYVRGLG